jgi:hypothetical protein
LVGLPAHHSERGVGITAADTIKEVKNLSEKLQAKSLVDARSLERREILIYG